MSVFSRFVLLSHIGFDTIQRRNKIAAASDAAVTLSVRVW